MRKRLKILSLILCAVLLVSMAAGCEQKTELTKLTLNEVTHSVFYAPQYAAIELGYFEEEGLSIELVNGGGADKVMTALLSNAADVGLMGPEASVYVQLEGKADYTQVIAQLTKRDGSFLIGRDKVDNFDWKSLEGKKVIGGRKGGVPCMSLESVLKKNGLVPGENVDLITNIQFDLMAGAFEGGEGDYVTLFEPAASVFEQAGKGYILASVGEAGGEVPFTAYAMNKSRIEKEPELAQKFVNAIYKGQKWVMSHSAAEIAEKIKPHFPDSDLETLTRVTQRHKDIDAWMDTPVTKESSINNLQDIMEGAGELKERADYSKLVNNTFAEKAVETIK